MARSQKHYRDYAKEDRCSCRPHVEKAGPALPLRQAFRQYRPKVKYVPKVTQPQPVEDPAQETATHTEGRREPGGYFRRVLKDVVGQPKSAATSAEENAVLEAEKKKESSPAQATSEEVKSDDATSIPDEDSREFQPLLLEIEMSTKEGMKRLEIRQGDDVHEFVVRICREAGFDGELVAAIEYKVTRALASEQLTSFTY